ncbi:MAG TPA: hypothetical protein VJ904_13900, partial [Tichowtungia sp.]|nr:hypothetical protein [Tichowtungia sp.]
RGIPAMGVTEQAALRELNLAGLPVRLTAWCRATEADLDAARACGYRSVHISFPVSPILLGTMGRTEEWVFQTLETLLQKNVAQTLLSAHRADRSVCPTNGFDFISVGAQDASRTNTSMLIRFAQRVRWLGAHRVRLADSVGCWNPLAVSKVIRRVRAAVPHIRLGVHMHDDLGMATANSITAVQNGATDVDVTVNGLGERAGNAPLEQVVMTLQTLPNFDHGIRTEKLYDLCRETARCAGRDIPRTQPIIGEDVFRHESGIHVKSLLKDRRSYEPYAPAAVGRAPELAVKAGKHSGSAAILHLLSGQGIQLKKENAAEMLTLVRAESEKLGRGLSLKELTDLGMGIAHESHEFSRKGDVV